jgi:hypothetical protein
VIPFVIHICYCSRERTETSSPNRRSLVGRHTCSWYKCYGEGAAVVVSPIRIYREQILPIQSIYIFLAQMVPDFAAPSVSRNHHLANSTFLHSLILDSAHTTTEPSSMGEVVNVLVAFAVIIFIFRWATSSKYTACGSWNSFIRFCFWCTAGAYCCCPGSDSTERRSAADTLGFRPKPVTQDMVRFTCIFYSGP